MPPPYLSVTEAVAAEYERVGTMAETPIERERRSAAEEVAEDAPDEVAEAEAPP